MTVLVRCLPFRITDVAQASQLVANLLDLPPAGDGRRYSHYSKDHHTCIHRLRGRIDATVVSLRQSRLLVPPTIGFVQADGPYEQLSPGCHAAYNWVAQFVDDPPGQAMKDWHGSARLPRLPPSFPRDPST